MRPLKQFHIIAIGLILVYLGLIIQTAWVADDTFLTLRTVDNFANGYRLTWNVNERVQIFTHPLWMLLIIPFYLLIQNPLSTMFFLTITLSMITMVLFAKYFMNNSMAAGIGFTAIIFSKAFIDYSTSGLENPLSHLLMIVFLAIFLNKEREFDERNIMLLSLVAGLAVFNRMDTLLFYFPALAYVLFKIRTSKALLFALIGFSPFILWELFSILYYGFPFPNTAYAKLNTGIDRSLLIQQGIYYLRDSVLRDPLSISLILFSTVLTISKKDARRLVIGLGVILYLLYLVKIGGDFMSGRFLSITVLVSIVLITTSVKSKPTKNSWALLVIIIAIGFSGPRTPWLIRVSNNEEFLYHRVADERLAYYSSTGLLSPIREGEYPNHVWVENGQIHKKLGRVLSIGPVNGMFAFYAGPQLHVVDTYGLGDALLARLPARDQGPFKIGHFIRTIPAGYWNYTIDHGNQIEDPNLSQYYEKLSLVIHGEIFDKERFVQIWRLNTGYYNYLLNGYSD